jgi:hypothetical protein
MTTTADYTIPKFTKINNIDMKTPKTFEYRLLYNMFSDQPYIPSGSWTRIRTFNIDPLLVKITTEFELTQTKIIPPFIPDLEP